MELHFAFVLGLLIGILPLFTFAFTAGPRAQRKNRESTGSLMAKDNEMSTSGYSGVVRRKSFHTDLPGLEKKSNYPQSVFPTLSTLRSKKHGASIKWGKQKDSTLYKGVVPKEKSFEKRDLDQLRKASHSLLKKSLRLLSKGTTKRSQNVAPKKIENTLKEKRHRSKPKDIKYGSDTGRPTLDFQKLHRFKRRMHAIRRRPSRPEYRPRRPRPVRKHWNQPEPEERPPPPPPLVDEDEFLSPCFHDRKRSVNSKRHKRSSHLHLPAETVDDEDDDHYGDEERRQLPPKNMLLNDLWFKDTNEIDNVEEYDNNSEKRLHQDFNKLHNLKGSVSHKHHGEPSIPRPSNYGDFLPETHGRKSQEDESKHTHQNNHKGGSGSQKKLSPTAVKELANKLRQIERNMKEKEENEIEDYPTDDYTSHPNRITSMDIRLLQTALKSGKTNKWVDRELKLIEHESKALKLKAKRLHNKLIRINEKHSNAGLYESDLYEPDYGAPIRYPNQYYGFPSQYEDFHRQNQDGPDDVRWRIHGEMVNHPPSLLDAMAVEQRNIDIALERRGNNPPEVYANIDQNHPRNVGHALSKLEGDLAEVKAMLGHGSHHGYRREERHATHEHNLQYNQQQGYDTVGAHGLHRAGPFGQDSGRNDDYGGFNNQQADYVGNNPRGFPNQGYYKLGHDTGSLGDSSYPYGHYSRDNAYRPHGTDGAYNRHDGHAAYITHGRNGAYRSHGHSNFNLHDSQNKGYMPYGMSIPEQSRYPLDLFHTNTGQNRDSFRVYHDQRYGRDGEYSHNGGHAAYSTHGRDDAYRSHGRDDGHSNFNLHGSQNKGYMTYGMNIPEKSRYPYDLFDTNLGLNRDSFHGYHDQRYPYGQHPHGPYDRASNYMNDNPLDYHNKRHQYGHGYDLNTLRNRINPHGFYEKSTGHVPYFQHQGHHHGHGYDRDSPKQGRYLNGLHNFENPKSRFLHEAGHQGQQRQEDAVYLDDPSSQRIHGMVHDLKMLHDLERAEGYYKGHENTEHPESPYYGYDHEREDEMLASLRRPGHRFKRTKRSLKSPNDNDSRQHGLDAKTPSGDTKSADGTRPMQELDKKIKIIRSRKGVEKLVPDLSSSGNGMDSQVSKDTDTSVIRPKAEVASDAEGISVRGKKLPDIGVDPIKNSLDTEQLSTGGLSDALKRHFFSESRSKQSLIDALNHKSLGDKNNLGIKGLSNLLKFQNSFNNAYRTKDTEHRKHLFLEATGVDKQHSIDHGSVSVEKNQMNFMRGRYPTTGDTISSTASPPEDSTTAKINPRTQQQYITGIAPIRTNTRKHIFSQKQHRKFLTDPLVKIRYQVWKPLWTLKGPAGGENYGELIRSLAQKGGAQHLEHYPDYNRKNTKMIGSWRHRNKSIWSTGRNNGHRRGFFRKEKKYIVQKSGSEPPVYQLERLKVTPNTEVKWLKIVSTRPGGKHRNQYPDLPLMESAFENLEKAQADYTAKTKEREIESRKKYLEPEKISFSDLNNKDGVLNDDLMSRVLNRHNFHLLSDDTFARLVEAILQFSNRAQPFRSKRHSSKKFFKREPTTEKELAMKKELVELLRRFPLSDEERNLNEKLKKEDTWRSHASDVGQEIIEIDKEDDQPFIDMEDAGDLLSRKDRVRRRADSSTVARAFSMESAASGNKSTPGKRTLAGLIKNNLPEDQPQTRRPRKGPKLHLDERFHEDTTGHRQKRHHGQMMMRGSDRHEHEFPEDNSQTKQPRKGPKLHLDELFHEDTTGHRQKRHHDQMMMRGFDKQQEFRKLKDLLQNNMKMINRAAEKFLKHKPDQGSKRPYLIAYPLEKEQSMSEIPLSHRVKTSQSRTSNALDTSRDETPEGIIKDRRGPNLEEAYNEDHDDEIKENNSNSRADEKYYDHIDNSRVGDVNYASNNNEDDTKDSDDEDRDDYENDDDYHLDLHRKRDERGYDEDSNENVQYHPRRYQSLQAMSSWDDTSQLSNDHETITASKPSHHRSTREASEDNGDYLGESEIDDIAHKKGHVDAKDIAKIASDEADEDNKDEEDNRDENEIDDTAYKKSSGPTKDKEKLFFDEEGTVDQEDELGDNKIDDIAHEKSQSQAKNKKNLDYDQNEEVSDAEEEENDSENDDDDDDDEEETGGEVDESEKEEGITIEDKGHLSEPKDDFAFVEKEQESKNTVQYSWSDWSECSVSCGIGRRFRSNRCADGEPCSGKAASTEVEVCSEKEAC